jgi:hypothetical protein
MRHGKTSETLEKAATMSEGIAAWIKEQRRLGKSDVQICQVLKATVDLVRLEKQEA